MQAGWRVYHRTSTVHTRSAREQGDIGRTGMTNLNAKVLGAIGVMMVPTLVLVSTPAQN